LSFLLEMKESSVIRSIFQSSLQITPRWVFTNRVAENFILVTALLSDSDNRDSTIFISWTPRTESPSNDRNNTERHQYKNVITQKIWRIWKKVTCIFCFNWPPHHSPQVLYYSFESSCVINNVAWLVGHYLLLLWDFGPYVVTFMNVGVCFVITVSIVW
jgi:hypothetical protein